MKWLARGAAQEQRLYARFTASTGRRVEMRNRALLPDGRAALRIDGGGYPVDLTLRDIPALLDGIRGFVRDAWGTDPDLPSNYYPDYRAQLGISTNEEG